MARRDGDYPHPTDFADCSDEDLNYIEQARRAISNLANTTGAENEGEI